MNTLPGIADAVAGLRLETEQLARDQLEAQVAELEFMHESEGFAPEDWAAAVEECVFRLRAFLSICHGSGGVEPILQRIETALRHESLAPELLVKFRDGAFLAQQDVARLQYRSARARLAKYRDELQSMNQVLYRAGPERFISLARTQDIIVATHRLSREVDCELAACETETGGEEGSRARQRLQGRLGEGDGRVE
ncbi:hypothetical protein ONZ51_g12759 [Trametes cubensis]|uniref:Uncharacterized protein n=1 Tax=Trametes cubensis TaxID=1111947 RepID=A0AAD7TF74_9APHY|nr:hypothetical protein ONZ51_g12759 [Trametes cubensis]